MKGIEFEVFAKESLESRRIRNLTPHPIRVLCGPFCLLGERPEPGINSWVEEKRSDGTMAVGGYVDIPSESPAARLEEVNLSREDVEVGRFEFLAGTPSGMMAACQDRCYVVPEEMPESQPGVVLVVSLPFAMGMVAAGCERDDVICPDTGQSAVRDGNGFLVAVKGFLRLVTEAQKMAHDRGLVEGIRQRSEASGRAVLKVDSRQEAVSHRPSYERGLHHGFYRATET